MKIKLLRSALVSIIISSCCMLNTAYAGLIGDKDWLQPSDTTGYTWAQLDSIFDTTTGECDVIGCMLGSTNLTGYTWATASEVTQMWNGLLGTNFEISDGAMFLPTNGTNPLYAKFNPTFINQLNVMVRNVSAGTQDPYLFAVNGRTPQDYIGWYDGGGTSGTTPDRIGVALYKTVAVPVPPTLAILALGMIWLVSRRFKKQS